jgi:hypothetical protein
MPVKGQAGVTVVFSWQNLTLLFWCILVGKKIFQEKLWRNSFPWSNKANFGFKFINAPIPCFNLFRTNTKYLGFCSSLNFKHGP